ncbi:hypothetical protein Cob_v007500 [Colletotrichum orbiculare MAFF 240422]|uniref:Uncharacterized protein n=1 Tax=Colletotrichum orbiculare (strain 104-T / ATCC 96160 / CBS 514.97 / LARS 414 / MAFF 240422) TaxID=1213857 RepID=N4V4N4_COLOR|nr:hypothetical protein Cob_v007500 [Colletotrichum orbiculare MAFF 240422]
MTRDHRLPSSTPTWDRERTSEDDLDDDDIIPNTTSESSKALLTSTETPPANRKRIPSYPILIPLVLFSALVGALLSLGISSLTAHLRSTSAAHLRSTSAAHRNDNTLASPSHDASSSSSSSSPPAQFDLISFNWLPPQCHDEPLAAAFESELGARGMLEWYEDANRTRPLSRAQIMTGEHTGIYVSLGYHLRHCTAMWRRMHRAIAEGGGGLARVDSYIWSYHHTLHCEEMLLGRYNESEIGHVFTTEVRIKYPDCGVLLTPSSSSSS